MSKKISIISLILVLFFTLQVCGDFSVYAVDFGEDVFLMRMAQIRYTSLIIRLNMSIIAMGKSKIRVTNYIIANAIIIFTLMKIMMYELYSQKRLLSIR